METEITPALRLILGAGGYLADESQVADFLRLAGIRGIRLADLWLAEIDRQMVWAVLPMVSPGRTMLMFGAPAKFAGGRTDAVLQTLDAVCREFAWRNIQLAQALLDPSDEPTIDLYIAGGFRRMAELLYLQRTLRRTIAPPPLPADCQLHSYSSQTHAGFAAATLGSYEQSLDCPPLNGVRDIEDILAGHQSAGEFDPADWFLLTIGEKPAGVLLLSRMIQGDGMELVYLGLCPWARGRGLGELLLRRAEARMSERKLNRLSLAVDAQNAPALRLYYRHGMQRVASKIALMKELPTAGQSEGTP
jgi:ribosomal protein S18 acetylase RimI-like enzyme